MSPGEQESINELRLQWKRLWHERIDDKIRAEVIAVDDYSHLSIEKGTIIHATRDYKDLRMDDIVDQKKIFPDKRCVSCNPHTGGLSKFIRSNITKRENSPKILAIKKNKQQLKRKNGRGWLNTFE